MFRLLTNIPIPVHGLLLVLTVVLRLPVFHANYFLPEESQYILLAKQIIGDKHLYLDAWYAGPPVMVWVYSLFYFLFGANALLAVRIFTCLYVYFTAVVFNGMLAESKPFRQFGAGLPAVLFVLMVSAPWYTQQLSSSLFILLPVSLAFYAFNQVGEDRRNNYRQMFLSGAWMMFCILATYKAAFILGGMMVAYIFLKKPQADEFLSLFGGMVAVFGGLALILFFNQSMSSYWDVGVLYYYDRTGKLDDTIYQYHSSEAFLSWIFTWGLLLLSSAIGFIHYRIRFYTYVTKIRSLELTMAVWLVGVLLVLVFKFRRLDMTDFTLLVPPLAFYTAKITDFRWGYRFRILLLVLVLAIPTVQFVHFFNLVWDKETDSASFDKNNWLMDGRMATLLKGTDPLLSYFRDNPAKGIVWLMDYRPEILLAANLEVPAKYTDFRMAYYKFDVFGQHSKVVIRSLPEPEQNIFINFNNSLPEYIIDPGGYFAHLQMRFPGIFSDYTHTQLDNYTIYRRETR